MEKKWRCDKVLHKAPITKRFLSLCRGSYESGIEETSLSFHNTLRIHKKDMTKIHKPILAPIMCGFRLPLRFASDFYLRTDVRRCFRSIGNIKLDAKWRAKREEFLPAPGFPGMTNEEIHAVSLRAFRKNVFSRTLNLRRVLWIGCSKKDLLVVTVTRLTCFDMFQHMLSDGTTPKHPLEWDRTVMAYPLTSYLANIPAIYLRYTLAFYLAFYLTHALSFNLALALNLAKKPAPYLTYIGPFHLTYILAKVLAFYLAYILAFFPEFYLTYILAFHLAFHLT